MGLDVVPMIVFAKGAWYALDALCNMGYQVVGLDWLQDPAQAVEIRGSRPIVFQGNADPGILYGSHETITRTVREIVDGFGGGKQGWIGNLGHGNIFIITFIYARWLIFTGITPRVNPDDLKFFLQEIRRLTNNYDTKE